jgi:hypothetical protein
MAVKEALELCTALVGLVGKVTSDDSLRTKRAPVDLLL